MANNFLFGNLRWHVDKLVEIQKELSELKVKNEALQKEKDNSSSNCANTTSVTSTCENCKALQEKVEYFLKKLSKFIMGRDNLEALLAQQKCVIEKAGLGYNNNKKQKADKIFFNVTKASSSPIIVCYYCMNKGHSSFNCWLSSLEFQVGNTNGFLWELKRLLTKKDPT